MKRTNIKDLARYLSLSPSTISRALADHPDLSPATISRVKEAAQLFHYVPNLHARYFRKKQSGLVALILPESNMFFIPSIINAVNQKLRPNNYSVLTFFTNNHLEEEINIIRHCLSWLVDGIIISISDQTSDLNHFEILKSSNIPVVLIDKVLESNDFSSVKIDDYQTSSNAVSYLYNQNCRSILGIFGRPNVKITQDRKSGFINKLVELNMFKSYTVNTLTIDSLENINLKVKSKLQEHHYEGIFTMSDELLFYTYPNVLQQLLQNKIKILSISDGEAPKAFYPKLPYLYHSGQKIGNAASEIILKMIANNEYRENLIVNTELVIME
jgi:LacI family transcriptional regulator